MKEVDYKAKYTKMRNKYNKAKPYFDTMARHNDRLNNENRALSSTVETFRSKIKALCPHKTEWLVPERQTKWGEEVRHYCDMCYSFILTKDIERKI